MYIHIPFCRGKCEYCSFFSIASPVSLPERNALFDSYLHALVRDIAAAKDYHRTPVDSVYFGGGTPSMFGHHRIAAVLKALRDFFSIAPSAEISIECNPNDIGRETIIPLIEVGINRVTVGVQTFHQRLRNVIGRFPPLAQEDILEEFMTMPDIIHCFDVIAGIPLESDEEFISDLSHIVSLRPEHISAYLLSVEKETPLGHRTDIDEQFHENQRRHLSLVMEYLRDAGYHHYEISNYCLPGFESRHNLKYWQFQPYLGFGAGAHGFTGKKRYFNAQTIEEYVLSPRYEEDERSENAAMAEYFMTALRLIDGFSEASFREIFKRELPVSVKQSLEKLANEKLIARIKKGSDIKYSLTYEGIFVSDYVIYRTVESLL